MGSSLAAATPSTVDTNPSIPFTPRLAKTRIPSRGAAKLSTSRTGMLDATTNDAPSGTAANDVARDAPLEWLVPAVEQRVDGRARRVLGGLPRRHPVGVHDHIGGVGKGREQHFRVGLDTTAHHVLRIEPRAVGVDHDLLDRGIEPLHRDPVGERSADAQDHVGAVARSEGG